MFQYVCPRLFHKKHTYVSSYITVHQPARCRCFSLRKKKGAIGCSFLYKHWDMAAAHVAGSVAAVQKIAETMMAQSFPRYCEFELRLGKLDDGEGGFTSGVDAAFIGALLCKLETSSVWSETTPWTQIVDRFFLLPSGLQVCSSSQMCVGGGPPSLSPPSSPPALDFEDCASGESDADADADVDESKRLESLHVCDDDGDGDDEGEGEERLGTITGTDTSGMPCYETSHFIKTAVAHVDLRWRGSDDVPDILRSQYGDLYDMRVRLKQQMPLFEDELQECVEETNAVRIKQRRSFKYTPVGKDRVRWAIDVTQVWQSTTYMAAMEQLRSGQEPEYEVDIECVDPCDFLKEMNNDTRRLSLSLLLKAADLFSITSKTPCRLLPVFPLA